MSLVDLNGMPVGQVGRSKITDKNGINYEDMNRLYEVILQRLKTNRKEGAIHRRIHISMQKVESAIAFWKKIYFENTIEGRFMNGIEAYELGDPVKTPGVKCDKGPYIAMCNLMALEAIRMMGDEMPTAEKAELLAFASDREKEISAFWKEVFAPTVFMAEWSWKAVLAVLVGNPAAISEILDNYQVQLP